MRVTVAPFPYRSSAVCVNPFGDVGEAPFSLCTDLHLFFTSIEYVFSRDIYIMRICLLHKLCEDGTICEDSYLVLRGLYGT